MHRYPSMPGCSWRCWSRQVQWQGNPMWYSNSTLDRNLWHQLSGWQKVCKNVFVEDDVKVSVTTCLIIYESTYPKQSWIAQERWCASLRASWWPQSWSCLPTRSHTCESSCSAPAGLRIAPLCGSSSPPCWSSVGCWGSSTAQASWHCEMI